MPYHQFPNSTTRLPLDQPLNTQIITPPPSNHPDHHSTTFSSPRLPLHHPLTTWVTTAPSSYPQGYQSITLLQPKLPLHHPLTTRGDHSITLLPPRSPHFDPLIPYPQGILLDSTHISVHYEDTWFSRSFSSWCKYFRNIKKQTNHFVRNGRNDCQNQSMIAN